MAAQGYIGRAPGESSVIVARQTFTPTGITTNFTFASGYTVGYVDAYLNGARLIEGEDYTATDGSVVGLTTHAQNGDVLELVVYKAFNVANVTAATDDFSVGGDLSVTGNTELTGTLTVGGVEVQPGAAGTWASYDSNTGISTTKKVKIENNLEVTGVGTITGDLTVGGVLTYDDVTNVDSIGIITARSHVSIADSILHTGDTDTSIRFPAADTFTVETAGEERVRINSSGNVGIGTDNPTEKLHVFDRTGSGGLIHYDGASNAHFGLRIRSNSDGGNFESDFANGTTAMLDLFADASTVSGGDFLVCRSQDANPILLVKGNGRIGVGTISPTTRLHVSDLDKTSTNARDNIVARFLSNASNADCNIQLSNGIDHSAQLGIVGNGAEFYIAQDGVERLRINSTGNIGIGTDNPTHNLQVHGSFPDIAISDSDTLNDKFRILYNGGQTQLQIDPNNVGPNASHLLISIDGSEKFRIGSDGQIGLGGANYGSTGQVLTSNGASSAPTWQDASGGDSLDVTASLFI